MSEQQSAPVLSEGQRRVLELLVEGKVLRSLGVLGYMQEGHTNRIPLDDIQLLLVRGYTTFAPYILAGATDFVITPAGRAALVDTDTNKEDAK